MTKNPGFVFKACKECGAPISECVCGMRRIRIKQCETCRYTKECKGIILTGGSVPDGLECLDYERDGKGGGRHT